jgi:hypothetical protein
MSLGTVSQICKDVEEIVRKRAGFRRNLYRSKGVPSKIDFSASVGHRSPLSKERRSILFEYSIRRTRVVILYTHPLTVG